MEQTQLVLLQIQACQCSNFISFFLSTSYKPNFQMTPSGRWSRSKGHETMTPTFQVGYPDAIPTIVCSSLFILPFSVLGYASEWKHGCFRIFNSGPIQMLSFLACAVVLFIVYLPLRIRGKQDQQWWDIYQLSNFPKSSFLEIYPCENFSTTRRT